MAHAELDRPSRSPGPQESRSPRVGETQCPSSRTTPYVPYHTRLYWDLGSDRVQALTPLDLIHSVRPPIHTIIPMVSYSRNLGSAATAPETHTMRPRLDRRTAREERHLGRRRLPGTELRLVAGHEKTQDLKQRTHHNNTCKSTGLPWGSGLPGRDFLTGSYKNSLDQSCSLLMNHPYQNAFASPVEAMGQWDLLALFLARSKPGEA